MSTSYATTSTPLGTVRSPWAVWSLSLLSLGVVYLVWYVRLNKALARAAGVDTRVGTTGLWLSQCLPLLGWISLARTAHRLTKARERAGLGPAVSGGGAVLASLVPGFQAFLLQRHANTLWRTLDERTRTVEFDPMDLILAYSRGPLAITTGHETAKHAR